MQSLTILALFVVTMQADPNWRPAGPASVPFAVSVSPTVLPGQAPLSAVEPVAVIRMERLGQSPSVLQNASSNTPDTTASAPESRPRGSWLPKFLRGEYWKRPAEPAAAPRTLAAPQRSARRDSAPSDRMLVSRCRALIHDDQELSGSVIHVTADHGIVYLRGTVSSERSRRRAEQVASKVEGARSIANELVLRQPDSGQRFNAPVTLSAPVRQDGTPLGTRLAPASPLPPTDVSVRPLPSTEVSVRPLPATEVSVAAAAGDPFVVPPAPNRAPARGVGNAASAWIPGVPTPAPAPVPLPGAGAPIVQLGQPEFLSSRQGLPAVTTFLIRRDDDPTTRPIESNSAKPAAFSIPGTPPASSASPPAASARAPVAPGVIQPAARFVVPTAPAPAPAARALGRPDIDTFLSRDPRAASLAYRIEGTELMLSGRVASARDLYDLADRLATLPGIGIVGFENLRVGD